MGYTKTDWTTATITADNFNKLQTQYAEAVADATGIRSEGTAELRAEVVSDFPAHQTGRIIYHAGKKMFFYSTGAEWLLDPKDAYWGDAQNGIFSSNANVTFSNSLGATVIRNYRNFTLNPSHTITTERGCRCLVIRSWGDITINGIIDLDYKGGFGDRYITIGGTQYDLLGGLGGNGGASGAVSGGADSGQRYAGGLRGGGGAGGSGGIGNNRAVIGGTGGPANTRFNTGALGGTFGGGLGGGSDGSPGSIGSGGGGAGGNNSSFGEAYGSRGATSVGSGAGGGGAGFYMQNFDNDILVLPSAHSPQATSVENAYGGGALVLLAVGNIVINGEIRARGGKGGDGATPTTNQYSEASDGGGGGGGSGGGKVIVIRKGAYQNAGTVLLTGGTGGSGGDADILYFGIPGDNGTAGATGTISTYQL